MLQKDTEWDKLLKIKTTGRDASTSNQVNYPYEPTDYVVLERLCREKYIRKRDVVLDYGCGKGRVDFFLAYQIGCKVIGVDLDPRMVGQALENKESGVSGARCQFIESNAASFDVPESVNRFYFFNPFSELVLQSTLAKIKESYYESPREMFLFFYYPSDEYIAVLMTEEELSFVDEIDCQDLFPQKDSRERILIFRIG